MKQKRKETELNYVLKRITEESNNGRIRVVLVVNSRSSQAKKVEAEAIRPIKRVILGKTGLLNVTFFQYEVAPTDVDNNAEKLAACLMDGDILVTLGGDGTATIGVNAAFLSGKKVRYYTLPFGNFNDIARTVRRTRGGEVYGLESRVDGEHFRFALCYFTMGMLAESTEVFDEGKIRERLRKKRGRLYFSLMVLFKWFMKNHKKRFIPRFRYELDGNRGGVEMAGISDVVILNGESMAKLVRGGDYYLNDRFLVRMASLQNIFTMCWFMIRGFFMGVKGEKASKFKITFEEEVVGGEVEIQAEGEYKKLKNVKNIEFKKTKEALQIL